MDSSLEYICTPEPYDAAQIVYRAIILESWISKDLRIKTAAFRRRRDKETHGLSCAPTPQDCLKPLSEPIIAMAVLNVGSVRSLNLDVVPDKPDHANIIGVPYRDKEESPFFDKKLIEEAERIATALANQAQPFLEFPNRKPR